MTNNQTFGLIVLIFIILIAIVNITVSFIERRKQSLKLIRFGIGKPN